MPQAVSSCPPLACDASAHGDRFVAVGLLECAHGRSRASSSRARASTAPVALCPQAVRRCGSDPCWHPVLSHGCFADRSDLAEVHTRDDLAMATNQITAKRVPESPIARLHRAPITILGPS